MSNKLTRRTFLSGTAAAAAAASGIASPYVARAADQEISALLITSGGFYPKFWETVTADFKAKTGITVKYDLLEFTPLSSKVVTLGAARSSQYDVYSTHTALIESYFNYFDPMNSYFSDSELAEFFPVTLKYLTNPRTGDIAAIPRNVDARVQFYRKDIYDEHGLKPAVTWEDLVDVSQKITGDGHYGLVVPGQGDPAQRTFSDLLWQAGGLWVDENNKPSFNSAEGIKALTYYRDLIHKYKVVPPNAVTFQWNENSSQFTSGTCYDTINWPGSFASFNDPEMSKVVDKWSTAPHVRDKEAISCAVSHALALNSQSKRKDPAVEFIKFAVGPEVQQVQFDEFSNFPSLQSTAKNVVAAATGAKALWLDQLQTTIANGKEWPKLPGFSKVSTLMYSCIESALSDQATPADALNATAADALEAMQRAGAYD